MSFSIIFEDIPTNPLSQYVKNAITQHFDSCPHLHYFPITPQSLRPCVGCFGCWLKTPGKCCINPLSAELSTHLVNDDVVIFISSIPYGSYSAPIKNVLDCSIPNVLPFFKLIKGEVHHSRRYKKLARHIVIAYGEQLLPQEKDTFLALTKANSLNLGIPDATVYFCETTTAISQTFTSIQDTFKKEGIIHG